MRMTQTWMKPQCYASRISMANLSSTSANQQSSNENTQQKVKLDLENKVRQEQALVIQRNKRNAELVQENDLLKSTLSGKEKSIAFLQSEKEKTLSEKKDLADSYLEEIICLKNANKVARDMLQRFNMPTHTIPMLSMKPKAATADLHKALLGTRNPGLGYMAKRAQPVLYDADTLLHPTHHPVSIWDSEEVLVHQVIQAAITFFKEIREFEQIFDELEAEYEQCVLDNKNLTIEKKNLLIKNDCLIAECLEKDICSIVLTSDIVVPPSSNCLCEDIRSACDREHTKVLELEAEVFKQQKMVIESEKRNSHLQKNHIDLQLKFQNYKQCIDTSSASNAIFEINKLRKQLQGKDDTIRNLETQINITRMLNVVFGSLCYPTNDYDDVGKLKAKADIVALTNKHTKLQAQVTGKTSSGPSTSETPKVLAPGMYNLGSKYIPPPKRANWDKPTPLPKKKQVTFVEPPRPSLKPTQKPVVHPNKQTNVANARRVEAHHRTLNKKNRVDSNLLVKHSVSVSNLNNVCDACNKSLVFANHNDCLVMCDDSVNVKPHQTKRLKRQPKKEWKPIKNVGKPIKRVWKPISKLVANSKPQWKPTGRHFSLFEKYPLTRIVEPTDMPIELPPSASSSPQITMVSRFTDHKLSDRKAGSKGISGSANCSMATYEYAAIVGYGDYKLGDTIISRVYYVHLDAHPQLSDMVDIDLLNGSRTTSPVSISLNDMMSASLYCFAYKSLFKEVIGFGISVESSEFRALNELARIGFL
ncbi:hypothetical protein Tco_1069521 [Tanacetum coccineum]|uniref:Uncharacterized protein n=1 Tax=Tanacetum coccineum TaxID=301880 RepID=A0ABQ5HJ25_9ASTR